jgi:glycosyltransferase involved in cell wall biosynthesis
VARRSLVILLNSLGPYGAENFVLAHARHADRSRHALTVCHMGGSTILAPALREAGVEVIDLGERRRFDPVALSALARVMRVRRTAILQGHVGYANIVARLVGRACEIPAVVTTEQTVRDDRDYSPIIRLGGDLTFRMAHVNVFISVAVRESFRATFPDRAHEGASIISNGIDAAAIAVQARTGRAAARAELGLAASEFAFVQVARLTERKGQRVAIDALATLAARHATLSLVGAGADEAALREHARNRGVVDRVRFLGARTDVHRILGAFDACVHPALVEGLGIAVLECMAARLPTIASATGGLPEFVLPGKTGWLVPPGDVGALSQHMAEVIAEPTAASVVAERGHEFVRQHHDIRSSVAAYERIYDQLLG